LPIALRPAEDKMAYTRVNFAGRPIYQLGISFFKVALLISYLRVLPESTMKGYRCLVILSITAIFLAHLGCSLALILACDPVSEISSWIDHSTVMVV
jgi:hypothetical protein